MAGTIAPIGWHTFWTDDGDPAVGYKLFIYEAGTTTKINTFTDINLTAANTNPIILDAAGRCVIFLEPGKSYKWVLAPPTDTDPPTSPIKTQDNIGSVPATGSNVDIPGVAGETMSAEDVVYLEDGTLGTAGRWYLTSNFTLAESAEAPKKGFVLIDAAAGEAITVRVEGRMEVSGTVVAGSIYYLSNTAGALETPAPSAEADFEMPYAFALADTASSLVFPLSSPAMWTKAGIRTIAFGTGQGNDAGGADTEMTSYDSFIPAGYLATAGNAIIIEGNMTVAANGDAKTVKVKVGTGTAVTVWSSSANVASHVVPFRIVIRRRTATTGSITSIFEAGVATAGAPTAYMAYTTIGTVAWGSNQVLNLYTAANTVSSIVLNDLTTYAVRTQNGAVV